MYQPFMKWYVIFHMLYNPICMSASLRYCSFVNWPWRRAGMWRLPYIAVNARLRWHINSSPLDIMADTFWYDIFKRISLNENTRISIQISLKFVHRGSNDNKSVLVQVMAHILNKLSCDICNDLVYVLHLLFALVLWMSIVHPCYVLCLEIQLFWIWPLCPAFTHQLSV